MRIKLQLATPDDVGELIALSAAVAERLRAEFGEGYWVSRATEKGTLFTMRRSNVYIARSRKKIIARVNLSTRKPWAIDTKYFTHARNRSTLLGCRLILRYSAAALALRASQRQSRSRRNGPLMRSGWMRGTPWSAPARFTGNAAFARSGARRIGLLPLSTSRCCCKVFCRSSQSVYARS